MITNRQSIKDHDELISEDNILNTQFATGNPFFANQDLAFSTKTEGLPNSESLYSVESSLGLDERTIKSIWDSLKYSMVRAKRLPKSPDVANSVALEYLRMGEIEKAIEGFMNALSINKHFFPAKANLAKCYSSKGDFDKALDIYRELEEEKQDGSMILMNMGMLYLNKKEFDTALTYFERAHKVDSENPSILNNIGLVYLAKQDANKAISAIRRALRINNDQPLIYNNLGVCFVAQRNFRKAIINFKIAYSLNNESRGILHNLATAYQTIGEHEKVVNLLSNYLQFHPEELEIRNIYAWSAFKLGRYQKSLNELEIVLKKTNEEDIRSFASLLNNIGIVYLHLGAKNKGKDFLLKSLDINPNDQVVHCNLVDFYLRSNQLDKVKNQVDYALSIFGNHPNILSYLAAYHRRTGDYQAAKKIYSDVVDADPNLLAPYVDLSSIAIDIDKDYACALEILEKGLKKHPNSVELINNYAYGLISEGRLVEARNLLDKQRHENSVYLMATRGFLLIREGNIEEGRQLYNRAALLAKNNRDRNLVALVEQKKHLELGKYYLENGNKREAKRLFKKGIKYNAIESIYQDNIAALLKELNDIA